MLPFGIDQMSVATQGHFEGLVTPVPVVSTPRDELRIATLGWIIIDFTVIPDPNIPTDALIAPWVACPVVEDGRNDALTAEWRADAVVEDDGRTEPRIIAYIRGDVVVLDYGDGTTATIPSTKALAALESGDAGAIIQVELSEPTITGGETEADVTPGSTDPEENP